MASLSAGQEWPNKSPIHTSLVFTEDYIQDPSWQPELGLGITFLPLLGVFVRMMQISQVSWYAPGLPISGETKAGELQIASLPGLQAVALLFFSLTTKARASGAILKSHICHVILKN